MNSLYCFAKCLPDCKWLSEAAIEEQNFVSVSPFSVAAAAIEGVIETSLREKSTVAACVSESSSSSKLGIVTPLTESAIKNLVVRIKDV